jgi:AcrR family transcriptional regulator
MNARSEQSPARTRRGRGRPSAEDATGLRDRILGEAEARFARKGYAATSVREIADAVDVNPAMVHYYFGSKHDLLRQVMERVLDPLGEALAGMKAAGRASPQDISRLLSGAGHRNPNLPLLMMREALLPGGVMQSYFLESLAPRLGGALPGIFRHEQAAGRLPADLDPNILALLLMAISMFPFIARGIAESALGVEYDDAGFEAIQAHTQRLLERGLTS